MQLHSSPPRRLAPPCGPPPLQAPLPAASALPDLAHGVWLKLCPKEAEAGAQAPYMPLPAAGGAALAPMPAGPCFSALAVYRLCQLRP